MSDLGSLVGPVKGMPGIGKVVGVAPSYGLSFTIPISYVSGIKAVPAVAFQPVSVKAPSVPSITAVSGVGKGISITAPSTVPSMMPSIATPPTTKSLSEVSTAVRIALNQITGNAEMLTSTGSISYDLYQQAFKMVYPSIVTPTQIPVSSMMPSLTPEVKPPTISVVPSVPSMMPSVPISSMMPEITKAPLFPISNVSVVNPLVGSSIPIKPVQVPVAVIPTQEIQRTTAFVSPFPSISDQGVSPQLGIQIPDQYTEEGKTWIMSSKGWGLTESQFQSNIVAGRTLVEDGEGGYKWQEPSQPVSVVTPTLTTPSVITPTTTTVQPISITPIVAPHILPSVSFDKIGNSYDLKLRACERRGDQQDDAFVDSTLAALWPEVYDMVMRGDLSYADAKRLIYGSDNISKLTKDDYKKTKAGMLGILPTQEPTDQEFQDWLTTHYKQLIVDTVKGLPSDKRDGPTVANIIAELSVGATDTQKHEIADWIGRGGFTASVNAVGVSDIDFGSVESIMKDPQNLPKLMMMGVGLGGIAGVGTAAKLIGGLSKGASMAKIIVTYGGAVSSVISMPILGGFFATEGPQQLSFLTSLQRNALKDAGQLGSDTLFAWDTNDRNYQDAIKSLDFDLSKKDPAKIQADLNKARLALNLNADLMYAHPDLFSQQPGFEDTVSALLTANDYLKSLEAGGGQGLVDKVNANVPENGLILVTPPEGGHIDTSDFHGGTDAPYKGEFDKYTVVSFKRYDKNGNLIDTKDLSVKPGEITTADWSQDISFETLQEEQTTTKITPTYDAIYHVGPNQILTIGNKWFAGGPSGSDVTIPVQQGDRISAKFTEPGKKSKVVDTLFLEKPTISINQFLEDAWVTPYEATEGFANLNFLPTQTVYIDGVLEDPKHYGQGKLLNQGYHHITVIENGRDTVDKDVYIASGQSTDVTLRGNVPFSPGGGGGVSGGVGGGVVTPSQALIVFGPTLSGARVWLDEVEIAPVIGQFYGTTDGYHAIKATKEGYKDWSKTVYAMSGTTLNIDAAWEPTTTTPVTPTVKQYIIFGVNSADASIELDSVLIHPIINTPFETTFGYHSVFMQKTNMKDWLKSIYVASGASIEVNPTWEPVETTPVPPVVSKSHIIFGITTTGATVYLDNQLMSVVPGQSYELDYGYHGLKLTMTGKQDWIKNVYLAAGDTLTVSPVFEDIVPVTPIIPVTPTPTTKRVYINSNPSSSKILINDGFTGQWTPAYIDLEKGLYKLSFVKSGYKQIDTWIWVGDVIAFGNTALSLAKLNGVI